MAWRAEIQGELVLDRTVRLGSADRILVDVHNADVRLESGRDGELRLRVFADSDDPELARRTVERMGFHVAEQLGLVVVRGGEQGVGDAREEERVRIIAVVHHPAGAVPKVADHRSG